MQEISQFLTTLFGKKPNDAFLLLWTLPDKRSYWFQNIEEMVEKAAELAERKRDVYVGVSMSDKSYGAERRILARDTVGIVGLWADVDIVDQHHKKGNLPPDERSAMMLMSEMGLEPTVTIHSGHGLQAWWLFKEPWIFTSDDDRQAAQQLSQAWTYTLKAKSKAHGWDSDATHDLARVLRVAGTTNHKGEPVPVRILDFDAERLYKPSDFTDYIVTLAEESKGSTRYVAGEAGPLDLNPNAQPPFEKWELLCEIEDKFKNAWDRNRKDLQDQSGSSYDMALATYAAQAGWDDQEIANLLIAHRRKHKDDLKLRQDYYARTIHKARDSLRQENMDEVIEQHLHEVKQEVENGEEPTSIHEMPEKKEALIASVSTKLGVKLTRIVKYVSDPPQYRLETPAGRIMLGEVQNLIGQVNFRNKMAAVSGILIPKFKPKEWDMYAQSLLHLCELEGIGDEATDAGQARAWLTTYLNQHVATECDEPMTFQQVIKSQEPFVKDGRVYIFGPAFRPWLAVTQGERITGKEMGTKFKALGCEDVAIPVTINGKPSTRQVWRLPVEFA